MSYSKYLIIKGQKPQREFKIGIAIPCHKTDIDFLKYSLHSIKNLNPQPYLTIININEGKTLKEIRSSLFNLLIKNKCDVIFQNSADFYLFKNILKHVKREKVCSFADLSKKPHDLTRCFLRLFLRNGWSGCYSMPKEIWLNLFQYYFDGTDTSVWKTIGKFNYDFRVTFSYYALRPYRKETTLEQLKQFPLWKRIMWQIMRLKSFGS